MNTEVLNLISASVNHDIIKDIGQREYNEDRAYVFTNDDIKYYAVLDGHGGSYVADHVIKLLESYFSPIKKNQQHELVTIASSGKTLEEKDRAFQIALKGLHDMITISVEAKFAKKSNSGTTMTALFSHGDLIVFTNIGDSMIYRISRQGLKEMIKQDDIGSREEKYIVKNKGYVHDGRVCGKLAMAKSIGDLDVQKYMLQGVKTKSMRLNGKKTFFILCSDGLSDILDENKELAAQCNAILCSAKVEGRACKDVNAVLYNFVKKHIDDNYTSLVVLL